jgi:CHAD domain-containing protein
LLSSALAVSSDTPEPPHGLLAMLEGQRAELVARAPGAVSGEQPDELRRLRVATRRIRAILRAARPLLEPTWSEPLRAELAWLASSLSPARDLDVLLAHVRAIAAHFEPGEQFALARAIGQLEDERSAARNTLRQALTGERFSALLARLSGELSMPRMRACDLKPEELATAEFRRLRKFYRRLGGAATDEELHDLRLRVKRARYTAELAERETTGAREIARFIARTKTVQDVLGEHQDAAMAEQHIRALLHRPHSIRWAIAAGRLIERQAVRREAARAAFPPAWAALERQGHAAFGRKR